MLPRLPAAEIFPRPCEDYTRHLGEHQAEAFALLWGIHEAEDPITDADGAHWHIARALGTPGAAGVRVAPPEVQHELHEAVMSLHGREGIRGPEIDFASLFPIIAGWQHEILEEAMSGFAADIAR